MWEHSWMMDYKTDKAGYVNNHWNIIDWDVVSARREEPI
jgi:superoxide dismutase